MKQLYFILVINIIVWTFIQNLSANIIQPNNPAPSPNLENYIKQFYPGYITYNGTRSYNSSELNKWFGHTFTQIGTNIGKARLIIEVLPADETAEKDILAIGCIGENGKVLENLLWKKQIGSTFSGQDIDIKGVLDYTWGDGDRHSEIISLDLSSLPVIDNYTLDLLPLVNSYGFLDVMVQDDTIVKNLQLIIEQKENETEFQLPHLLIGANDPIKIPIRLLNPFQLEIEGLHLSITYDHSIFQANDFSLSEGILDNPEYDYNEQINLKKGEILIAIPGFGNLCSKEGTIGFIEFKAIDKKALFSKLTFKMARMNEKDLMISNGSITINDIPHANDILLTTLEDTPNSSRLSAANTVGNALIYSIVTRPAMGTVLLDETSGVFQYTPFSDMNGIDVFTYKANDGLVDSNIASITITVIPQPDPPTISTIEPLIVNMGTIPEVFFFTVHDVDGFYTPTVSASSDYTKLVSNENIHIEYINDKYYVQISPNVNQFGTANITIDVMDNDGISIQTLFPLTVLGNTISGQILYYKQLNSESIVEQTPFIVLLTNDEQEISYTTTTDVFGRYRFVGLPEGAYTIIPIQSDNLGGLNSIDAGRIARHSVDKYEFNCFEKMAADVSQNGRIFPLDASRVARYTVGLVDCLDEEKCNNWIFLSSPPENDCALTLSYRKVNLQTTAYLQEDFIAIRIGDVSGDWLQSSRRRNKQRKRLTQRIAEYSINNLSSFTIPVALESEMAVEGLDLALSYDPDVFSVKNVSLVNGCLYNKGYQLTTNRLTPGYLTFSIYPMNDVEIVNNVFAFIVFESISDENALISINRFECNEVPVSGGFVINGELFMDIQTK